MKTYGFLLSLFTSVPGIMAVGGIGTLNLVVNPYDPYCAMACVRSIYGIMLSCSEMDNTMVGMVMMQTSAQCWASNEPYLETLAYCMHVKCDKENIKASKLEWFWETEATGQSNAGQQLAVPKWTYSEALAQVKTPPTNQLNATDTWLNVTSLVSETVYQKQRNVLTAVNEETARENLYGIVLLVVGFALPLLVTLFGYIPLFSKVFRKLKPYVIWPSTFGTYQVRQLPYLLGNAPTMGQGLYIVLFLVLNIILTSVNYHSWQPNAWYASRYDEIRAYVLYRTGALAYIFAPLIFLFASRNNFLLWLTNWSHSTFLVLHRWVARVFTLQAIVHSIIAVKLYQDEGEYSSSVSEPYWIWGIVATLAAVILTFASGLYVRNFAYELFLLSHIALSVILIAACWYHAYDLYRYLGGYSIWLVCCIAIWFFDRTMRVARIVMEGPRSAQVTEIGGGYVRIDVPGIRWGSEPGKHVFCYFPTLTPWRPWENHPFSVLSTALLHRSVSNRSSSGDSHSIRHASDEHADIEKSQPAAHRVTAVKLQEKSNGLTLYVRRSTGLTKSLRASDNLLMLVEGPSKQP